MDTGRFIKKPLKKFVFILIIIVFVVGFFIVRSKGSKGTPLQYAQVKFQDIAQTVSASGVLAGVNTANVKFQSPGKIANIWVKVGDKVSTGSQIANLDTQSLQVSLTAAQNTLRQTEATVANILDQVQGHAKDETPVQRDIRTKAEVARDNAYEAVVSAEQSFQNSVVYAPFAGVITQVNNFSGQNVSVADTVSQVVDLSKIYFDADVDEADVAKVAAGQNADVSLNSYSNQTLHGTVAQILPTTRTTSSGAVVVTARIDLGHPDINFVVGLNGQSNIIQSEAKNVATIPIEALQDDNTVYVKNGNTTKLVKVTTGLKSDTAVEITQGLESSDSVVTNPQAVPKK